MNEIIKWLADKLGYSSKIAELEIKIQGIQIFAGQQEKIIRQLVKDLARTQQRHADLVKQIANEKTVSEVQKDSF
jgi:hypothetical protein